MSPFDRPSVRALIIVGIVAAGLSPFALVTYSAWEGQRELAAQTRGLVCVNQSDALYAWKSCSDGKRYGLVPLF